MFVIYEYPIPKCYSGFCLIAVLFTPVLSLHQTVCLLFFYDVASYTFSIFVSCVLLLVLCCLVCSCWLAVSIVVVILCVFVVLCVRCFFLTAGLLARSQYSESPATGHLDTGFSWFPVPISKY